MTYFRPRNSSFHTSFYQEQQHPYRTSSRRIDATYFVGSTCADRLFSRLYSAIRVGWGSFPPVPLESPSGLTEGARMYQLTADQIRDRRANLRRPAKRAADKRAWRTEARKEVSF